DSVYCVAVFRVSGVDVVKLSVESARNAYAVQLPGGATVTVRGLPFSRVGFPDVGVTELPLDARTATSLHPDDPTLSPPLSAAKAATADADVRWRSAKPGPRGERDGFSGVPLHLESPVAVDARLRLPGNAP